MAVRPDETALSLLARTTNSFFNDLKMKKRNNHYRKNNNPMMKQWLLLLTVWMAAAWPGQVSAQCDPDVTPPVAACVEQLALEITPGGTLTLYPSNLNTDSYDACSGGISLYLGHWPASLSDMTTSLTFDDNDIGNQPIVLWVVDAQGNYNYCAATLKISHSCDGSPSAGPFCLGQQEVTVGAGDTLILPPGHFLEGAPFCSDYLLGLNTVASEPFLLIDESDVGVHYVEVKDQNSGESCFSELTVNPPGPCDSDLLPPVMACDQNLIARINESGPGLTTITVDMLDAGSYDNCSAVYFGAEAGEQPSEVMPSAQQVHFTAEGFYNVWLWGADAAGNTGYCLVEVEITSARCSPDATAPHCRAASDTVVTQAAWLAGGINPMDTAALNQAFGTALIWDNCALDTAWQEVALAYDCGQLSSITRLYTAIDATGNTSGCVQTVHIDNPSLAVTGLVFADNLSNCQPDAGDLPLAGWTVRVRGLVTNAIYEGFTNAEGYYLIDNICLEDTAVEVSLAAAFNYGQSCGATWTLDNLQSNEPEIQHIPVQLANDCPLMQLSLGTPSLVRCETSAYTVNYCNLSTQTITGVRVEVFPGASLTLTQSSLPAAALPGGGYAFFPGDLAPGNCGAFTFEARLDCEADPGLTHCVEAHIYPDTLCPALNAWSGANIEVEGNCTADSIYLHIRNTGAGDMDAPLRYIVVEDVIMYEDGEFQLNSGQSLDLPAIASEGQTWRLQAQQASAHPYPGSVAIAVEGCNGFNIPGLPNLFPLENPNPFVVSYCRQEDEELPATGNMLALPRGYGAEHYIEQGVSVEYIIQAPYTAGLTPVRMVVLDTLDAALDAERVQVGASSHPLIFELLPGGVLRFTLETEAAPGPVAGHPALATPRWAYVSFRAQPLQGTPLDTRIENRAWVTIDNQPAHATDLVFHTLGENFIEVVTDVQTPPAGLGDLVVFPNPSMGDVHFVIPGEQPVEALFLLFDSQGRQLLQAPLAANSYRFQRGRLGAGMYFYRVALVNGYSYSGKVILR